MSIRWVYNAVYRPQVGAVMLEVCLHIVGFFLVTLLKLTLITPERNIRITSKNIWVFL